MSSEEKRYTEEQMMGLVQREVQKQRMVDLETHVKNVEVATNKSYSNLTASVDALKDMITEYSRHVDACKNEIRKEIEEDYVSHVIFDMKIQQLETKITELWIRITVAVVAGVSILEIVMRFLIK